MKRISGFVQMYSTVGDLVPICRLKILLKIWATSFLPYENNYVKTIAAAMSENELTSKSTRERF